MSYSTAYQDKVAGRVREDEAVAMFRDNKVAVATGVRGFHPVGGDTQPTIKADHLQHSGVGKSGNVANATTGLVTDNLSAYNPSANNVI